MFHTTYTMHTFTWDLLIILTEIIQLVTFVVGIPNVRRTINELVTENLQPWASKPSATQQEKSIDSKNLKECQMNPHSIINVDKTLILAMPPKQNGRPIGYTCITLLSIISSLKRRVWRLWRLIYGLLTMAMLVGPLMDVRDSGKVRNRRAAKSQTVLIPVLLILFILAKKFVPRRLIVVTDTAL